MGNCCDAIDAFILALERAIANYKRAHLQEHEPKADAEAEAADDAVFIARSSSGNMDLEPRGGIIDVSGYVSA